MEDLSMQGVFLRTLVQLELDSTVTVSIPNTPIQSVFAKVVRTSSHGAGLQLEKTIFG